MKDLLKICFMISLVIVVYIFKDNISTFILDNVIYGGSNKVLTYNEYYLDYDYKYVQNIDKQNVENYQELLNMFYTVLNSGDNSYSFYCDYNNCLNDIKKLIDEKDTMSNINNFVHPFNSFDSINIDISNSGKITVKNKKAYNEEELIFVKAYIDTFIITNNIDTMNNRDKIKAFHDHIINITKYDSEHTKESYTAYDLLTTGKSICGGYSDIMAIYLNTIGLQNYKINSDNHIWNLVNLDGTWYHLDLTWDDPVNGDNNYLLHNFFLIPTNELHKLDKIEHSFDSNVYAEAK